jgi:hypothetical protein
MILEIDLRLKIPKNEAVCQSGLPRDRINGWLVVWIRQQVLVILRAEC